MKKILFSMVSVLLLSACGQPKTTGITVRLAHSLPENHPIHQAYVYFGERVSEYSKGKYTVSIYANEQLGTQRQTIQLAQSGGVEFFHMNAAILENFAPIFTLINLPYVFKDNEHYYAFMGSDLVRSEFDKVIEKGFVPITYFDGGVRSFYNKVRPIKTPADLKGLKIRVQESPTFIKMIQLLGGSPVAMAGGEIYTALQQGVIDGAENTEVTFLSQKHNETSKYFSRSYHQHASEILSVGAPFWSKLSDEDKEIFLKAGKDLTENYDKLWQQSIKDAIETLSKEGIEFNDVNTEPFRKLVLPMQEEYAAQDPAFKNFLDYVRSLEK